MLPSVTPHCELVGEPSESPRYLNPLTAVAVAPEAGSVDVTRMKKRESLSLRTHISRLRAVTFCSSPLGYDFD